MLYNSAMLRKCLLALLLIVPIEAQTPSVNLGGVELRLGMSQESVLAKFAALPSVQADRITNDDLYFVQVRELEIWEPAGDLWFHDGKLGRITIVEHNDNKSDTAALAKSFYNAVADTGESGLLRVWTERNNDAKQPSYEVHLLFKDREIIVKTSNSTQGNITSTKTYYPTAQAVTR